MPELIIGIDLSGPSNHADSVVAIYANKQQKLQQLQVLQGASDSDIMQALQHFQAQADGISIGIDAPLSYNDGGGDRPADKALRRQIVRLGLHSGSIMTPTMSRMVYLTLRGHALARNLQAVAKKPLAIAEVHPGASMALNGANLHNIKMMKHHAVARQRLLQWLQQQGLQHLNHRQPTDHYVAASAAAMATWHWQQQRAQWLYAAQPPLHPFDFVC